MRYPRTRRGRLVLGLTALTAGFALAGCGASDGAGTDSAAPQPAAAGADAPARNDSVENGTAARGAAGVPEAVPKEQQPGQQPGQQPARDLENTARSMVYTGSITVRVDDVSAAARDVAALATTAGGLVGADERQASGDRSEARLVLRVPADRFGSTMDEVQRRGIGGKAESRSAKSDDVTQQMVDLEVRVANAQASVERVRGLMARAQTIGEIVSLESELARREADLESLKGRKRVLDDRTALSTITATLLGKAAKATEPEPDSGFLAGLKAGWRAFVTSLRVVLTVFGALLPWLAVLGIPLALGLWLSRRLRRRQPVPPPPTPADPAGTDRPAAEAPAAS